MLDGIDVWLESQRYESMQQAGNLSHVASTDPSAFELSDDMPAVVS